MTDTLTCRACEREKPLKHFKKLGSAMVARSPTGRTHSNDCDACRLQQRADRKARREAAEADAPPQEPETPNNNPKVAVPMCMAVDVEYDGSDFVLTQDNDGTTHTVFLAPHALRALWEFAEGLALKQALDDASSKGRD